MVEAGGTSFGDAIVVVEEGLSLSLCRTPSFESEGVVVLETSFRDVVLASFEGVSSVLSLSVTGDFVSEDVLSFKSPPFCIAAVLERLLSLVASVLGEVSVAEGMLASLLVLRAVVLAAALTVDPSLELAVFMGLLAR